MKMKKQEKSFVLAADIGGSHITSAIIDTDTWSILEYTINRAEINALADAKSIIQNWSTNLKYTLNSHEFPVFQIGLAMPAPFDYQLGISYMRGQNKFDALYGLPISEALQQELQIDKLQFRYINDAAAFLQGEIYAQALTHHTSLLGVTLGTGLGSAYWHKGQRAMDANLWQAPYRDSYFENYLTTHWFTNRFQALTGLRVKGLKEILAHTAYTEQIKQIIEEFQLSFADFLAYFSELHQSNTIILGGNISKAWDILHHPVLFQDYTIIPAVYNEKAALIGAASLFSS